MQKTLVLVRHAHRDNSKREVDNGLDEKGREQAKAVKKFFTERFSKADLETGLWLVSSPKIRCVETLQPIAKAMDASVDVHPGLDEQSARENLKAFEARIQSFLREWMESKVGLTVLCSHGDWLPLATQQLLGIPQSFKKGAWLEVDWNSANAELRWYIPSFKPLFK